MSTPGSGRRTPSRGSRPAGRGGARPARATRAGRPARVGAASPSSPRRGATPAPPPRLTTRAAVLVLVVAVLTISASSLARAYLPLRDNIEETMAANKASEARSAQMQRDLERFEDPAYVEMLGRQQGYVFPGETTYVITEDGHALDVEATLSDPDTVDPAEPPAWWDGAWGSMKVAGNPPKRTDPPPATTIKDPEGAPKSDSTGGE